MHAAALRLSFVTAIAAIVTAFAAGSASADPGHSPTVHNAPSHHDHASYSIVPAHRPYQPVYAAPTERPRPPVYATPAYAAPVYAAPAPRQRPRYATTGRFRRRPITERVLARPAPRLDRDSRILQRRADLDGNGRLDAGERADLATELRRMKRDGDTRFTDTSRASRLVRDGDRNRDGRLSVAELRAMLHDASLMQVFAAFDRNSDRMLSRNELDDAPMLDTLRRADLDRSAYLSWRELDSFVSRPARHARLNR